MKFDFNDKKFVGVSNSASGEVGAATIFHYFVKDGILSGTYEGGQISVGQLLGTVNKDSSLDFAYHHINNHGELKIGKCHSNPELLPDGRIRLFESWEWLDNDDNLSGTSVVEEIIT